MAKHNVRLADFPRLPSPVYFRYSDFAPDTDAPQERVQVAAAAPVPRASDVRRNSISCRASGS